MVVDDVWASLFEVVVDHVTRRFAYRDATLARFLVLDRRIRVRAMVDLEMSRVLIERNPLKFVVGRTPLSRRRLARRR